MSTDGVTGIALARAYFHDVVRPVLAASFPGLPYSAGRLGTGSDVLGLDDATSRDHDWGLRLQLLVPEPVVAQVTAVLDRDVPASFRGLPTRFPFTGTTDAVLHVDVLTMPTFLRERLGFDPRAGLDVHDWLSLPGQAVLEVTAGAVFVDAGGELAAVREALAWYPDDLWRHLLACDWSRIAQELPLLGRATDVGDDLGARIIAARLVHAAMHLAFLLERRWAPYAKWFGTVFEALPGAAALGPHLRAALGRNSEAGIAAALQHLLDQQNALGLTDVARATVPFWDRAHLHPDPAIVRQLLAAVRDEDVRALPRGLGSIEQRTDAVDLLVDPQARRRAVR